MRMGGLGLRAAVRMAPAAHGVWVSELTVRMAPAAYWGSWADAFHSLLTPRMQ